MFQRWHDLLFAHWPIEPERMRALVPAALELDLFDGQAWLAVVPFRMSAIRLRGLPPVPGTSAFEELNVRTYVKAGGRRGRRIAAFASNRRETSSHSSRNTIRRSGNWR